MFIDGVDISGIVRAITVRSAMGEADTVTLELYVQALIDTNGAIRIRSGAGASEAVALPGRGILIRSDD